MGSSFCVTILSSRLIFKNFSCVCRSPGIPLSPFLYCLIAVVDNEGLSLQGGCTDLYGDLQSFLLPHLSNHDWFPNMVLNREHRLVLRMVSGGQVWRSGAE